MPAHYDFLNLSFDDFERLCADLLQIREGVIFEAFRIGRDDGVDLRYAPSSDRTTIVQCKRYAPEAFSRLKRDLKKNEIPKVAKLAPDRYILCTSCKLSPNQKDELFELLQPHCEATGDVLGVDDLNLLLNANELVERRHFKLWLGSTAILKRILHAGIFAYSDSEIASLQREISRYVVHGGFYRALSLLDQTHHCIIVGIPGVGKTIAARLLIAHYLREGFDVVSVTHDIGDAWKVIDLPEDAKVVIYYDDFLGQMTFSQKLGKNEDRRLLELVAHCTKSKNKRFILTTRDYIFDQALAAYEPLWRAKDALEKSRVKLDDYGLMVRARLLANHLQFSSVGADTLKEIVTSRAYDKIIRHQNFLPRVIEQLCSDKEVLGKTPSQFIDNAMLVLDDPSLIWRRPFGQLSQEARYLAYALASVNGDHEMGRLEEAWRALCEGLGYVIQRDFVEVLREVEGSFTHCQMYPGLASRTLAATFVRFINPSAREFVLGDLISKPSLLRTVVTSAVAFKQLLFWTEARTSFVGKTPEQLALKIASDIAERASDLLEISEPSVSFWAGEVRVQWRTKPQRISRLRSVFEALQRLQRTDLYQVVVSGVSRGEIGFFRDLLSPGDLMWASEVMQTVLAVQKRNDPEALRSACATLGVLKWADLAYDFPDVGFLWDAACQAIEVSDNSAGWDGLVRDTLAARARELYEAIPAESTADEIAQQAEELELLSGKLERSFAKELRRLDERADMLRASSIEDGDDLDLWHRYSGRRTSENDVDVDGIFRNLLEQLRPDDTE